jgi:acyl-CoA synthetase (AMP-forming)/AMP-acid ligase II
MVAPNVASRVNVGDMLTRTASRSPGVPAIVDGDLRLTFGKFNAWVNRLAHGLQARGYARGDALAITSSNRAEFLVSYYACAKLGVVAVPTNLGWTPTETAYALTHSGARGVVVERELIDLISVAPPADVFVLGEPSFGELSRGGDDSEPIAQVEDRDPLQYLYTSGTTSAPKGVVTSHLAAYIESLGGAIDKQLRRGERMACVMPLFHVAQLNTFCTMLIATGATSVLMRGFEAAAWLDTVEREHITLAFLLPMMIRELLGRPDIRSRDLSSLRLIVYAMAPMPQHELELALEVFGCEFALSFGQTELSPETMLHLPERQLSHIGAVGSAATNVQVGIMSEAGDLLGPGDVGEIVYRSPQVMTGYLRDQPANQAAFRGGWFHSGDLGRMDEDRVVYFVDRLKDVIKTGGENVASIEIETACFDVDPAIADVAVIGLPHERWVEAVTAIVVPKDGCEIDTDRLRARLRERLGGFKAPKAIVSVPEMPRTATGKIQKAVLRDRFVDLYGP